MANARVGSMQEHDWARVTCQYNPESKSNDLPDWSAGCSIHTSNLFDEAVMPNRHGFELAQNAHYHVFSPICTRMVASCVSPSGAGRSIFLISNIYSIYTKIVTKNIFYSFGISA